MVKSCGWPQQLIFMIFFSISIQNIEFSDVRVDVAIKFIAENPRSISALENGIVDIAVSN